MSLSMLGRVALARTRLGAVVGHMPWVEQAYARHAAARRDTVALHWGVFDSHEAAAAAIPAVRATGWDHDVSARMWVDYIDPVRPSTYPVLFWLRLLMQAGTLITDLGGSIGLTYYGYRRFARLPDGAQWLIVEVPHIVAEGRRVARREHAAELLFETDMPSARAHDILLAAGVLQFMEHGLTGLLEQPMIRPRIILLNKVPLTYKPDFWTLHNYGPAIAPCHIFNESVFLGYFSAHGYVVKDRWSVTDMSCDIPFHPDHTVPTFTGFCMERFD